MPYLWLRRAKDAKEKHEIEQFVLNNTRSNRMMLQILSELYDNVERKGDKEDDYKEAGILALIAFRNGQMSMLKQLADLFNFSDQKKD